MNFYSQDEQDLIIDTLSKKKENGIFVDIGAHNGIKFSNSYFFENQRNWTGVCVEPMPEVFAELEKNRKCHLVNGVISDTDDTLEFRRIIGRGDMLSGIAKYQSEEHKTRMEQKIVEVGSKMEVIEVKSYQLAGVLNNLGIKNIDYLSLDVEGAEFEILSSIDFKSFDIKFMTIENNYNDSNIRDILKSNNFKFLFKFGSDDFYVHNQHHHISMFFNPKIFSIWLKFQIRKIIK